MNSFDKLLTNISWMYDKGYPDFNIKEDREILYKYLLSIGFPHSDVIDLSERFIDESDASEKAKKLGLKNISGPWYSKTGEKPATHKSSEGDIVPLSVKKKTDKTNTKVTNYGRGGEEKDEIDAKVEKQKEKYAKKGLDEFGKPTGEPKNPNLDKDVTGKVGPTGEKVEVLKVHNGLDNVNAGVQESNVIPDEDKKNIISAIQKIKEEKVETMTKDEIESLRRWVAVKDQSGQPEEEKRSAEFYIADVSPNDWRFGKKSVGAGQPAREARKKATMTGGKGKAPYDEIVKLADAVGLKMASPTNSRTTSKMMAPTAINGKRKEEEITVDRKGKKIVSATIAGQTHTKKPVPKISAVEKALIGKGMDADEAKRKARSVVIGIKRYNDQIDLLAEQEGKLEVVDYGDTSTTEGKKTAINQCLQDLANTLEKKLESTTPPHPPLSRSHYEISKLIRNIKNPLEDPEWDNLSFEEQQKRAEQFNEDMGNILVEMNASGDMMTSRAEVAEAITYMHRLSQGFTAILPSSETFKVTDVYAIKDPGDTKDPEKLAESIQQVLVSIEVSGGESVKFDGGARSSSAGKVSLTVYKNKGTRKSINDLLDTYDKVYNGPEYPPSDAVIKELDNVRDATKTQVVNDGIMTEEEYDKIYNAGLETGEKAFNTFMKKAGNKGDLEKAGFTEDDLRRVKESFMKHCGHGKVMAGINNRDTEYNKFNNVAHKISGFKKDKETKEVVKKGKYKTVEADGINTISGMDFSCDQGFSIASPPKKKISPENTNPSAIIALDARTGKKVN